MPRTDTAQADRRLPRQPWSSRYLVPRDAPHYGELAAAVAVAGVLAHLLLAQLTLLLVIVLQATGMASRWRLAWLTVPAGAGLVWMLAVGPAAAAAGFAAGPRHVLDYLAGLGGHPGHLLSPQDAYAGLGDWLPRQFPLALMLASAETAGLAWLQRRVRGVPAARAGLIVAARRLLTVITLRSGGVASRDGAIVGVDLASGRPAAFSWQEAEGGVLCAGPPAAQAQDGFAVAWAAIRRRKPVVIIDLSGSPHLAESLAGVCAEPRAPFTHFSQDGPGNYEPLRGGDPARSARLVSAMIDWSEVSDQQRRSATAYLADALAVLAAAPAARPAPVLEELDDLLTPAGLRQRAARIPAHHPRRDVLTDRATVSAGLLQSDPGMVSVAAEQLAALRTSVLGRWLRPEPDGPGRADPVRISLGRTISERGVTLFSLSRAAHGSAATMIAELAVADLLAVAAELEGMSVAGDGLIWINDCDGLRQADQPELIAPLIARGRSAGLAVVLSATAATARSLAAGADVLVAHWPVDSAVASAFAARSAGAGTGASAGNGGGAATAAGGLPATAAGGLLGTAASGLPGTAAGGPLGTAAAGGAGTSSAGAAAAGLGAPGDGAGGIPGLQLTGPGPARSSAASSGAPFALLVAGPGTAAGNAALRVLRHCRSVPAWPAASGQ